MDQVLHGGFTCILDSTTRVASLQRKPDWKGLFVDGLHFSPEGQQAVLKLVLKTIDKSLPHLRHGL